MAGRLLVALQLALGVTNATAQDAAPWFHATTLVGEAFDARLRAINPSGAVTLGDRSLPLADLSELTRVDLPAPSEVPLADHPASLLLRSGTRLPVRSLHAAADGEATEPSIEFVSTLARGARSGVALRYVAAIRFGPASPAETTADGGYAAAVASPPADADLVFARGREGDPVRRYSMRVVGVAGADLRVDAGRGEIRNLPIERVYGVVFGRDHGAAPAALPRPLVQAVGRFGAPIEGRLLGWDGARCEIELAERIVIDLPCDTVEKLLIDSGRVLELSDLAPARVVQTPALNRVRPWLRDRTPAGDGLQIGGESVSHGLCLVPRTSLTFSLQGRAAGFDVFEATLGIDDRASELAHAVLRVSADGKVVFESGPKRRGDRPDVVSIALEGVSELTLETDFGDNLDFGDHCVFAGARLRKL